MTATPDNDSTASVHESPALPPGIPAWQAVLAVVLAEGVSRLRFTALDEHARGALAGLEALGVATRLDRQSDTLEVQRAGGLWPTGEAQLYGTTPQAAWALIAACTLGLGRYEITGNHTLPPVTGLVNALRDLGAGIGYADQKGHLPVTILARGLDGGTIRLAPEPAPPWLSALLLVAPCARGDVFLDAPPGADATTTVAALVALWLWAMTPEPGEEPERIWPGIVVLVAAAVYALFTWVFPEVAHLMPFNDTTVGEEAP